jgi:hypothetical protein
MVTGFIRKEMIYCCDVPNKTITDNSSNLNNKMMSELCQEFNIKHHKSSPYPTKMNGTVEAANKNIKKIV